MTQPTGDQDISTTHITDIHTTHHTDTTHHTTDTTTGEVTAASLYEVLVASVDRQQILMFNSKHLCINFILDHGGCWNQLSQLLMTPLYSSKNHFIINITLFIHFN